MVAFRTGSNLIEIIDLRLKGQGHGDIISTFTSYFPVYLPPKDLSYLKPGQCQI